MNHHYRGYKSGKVPIEEQRQLTKWDRKTEEFCCPYCIALPFKTEAEYKYHYKTEHSLVQKHNDHILRMNKLRQLLIRKIESRNATAQ